MIPSEELSCAAFITRGMGNKKEHDLQSFIGIRGLRVYISLRHSSRRYNAAHQRWLVVTFMRFDFAREWNALHIAAVAAEKSAECSGEDIFVLRLSLDPLPRFCLRWMLGNSRMCHWLLPPRCQRSLSGGLVSFQPRHDEMLNESTWNKVNFRSHYVLWTYGSNVYCIFSSTNNYTHLKNIIIDLSSKD